MELWPLTKYAEWGRVSLSCSTHSLPCYKTEQSTLFLLQSRGQPWLFRHRHGEQAVFSWLSETESVPPSFSQLQCILLQPIF